MEPSTPSSSSSFSSEEEIVFQPFRFFDLPLELRRKIMGLVLHVDQVIDIGHNARSRIATFYVSKRWHQEAASVFYGGNTFRILPTHGRAASRRSKPLIRRLPPSYRALLISLELRLGPHWHKPPACWKITNDLGLEQASLVRVLKVFIECDPSHAIFNGFRKAKDFYTEFSGELLQQIIQRLPNLAEIQFDGWPSVSRDAPLMSRLVREAKLGGKVVSWGPGQVFNDPTELLQCDTTESLQGMVPFYSSSPLGLKVKG